MKTAAHLERMILSEVRRHAICAGVAAVTVREASGRPGWEIADIQAPGGASPVCRAICLAAADELRQHYDLLPESHLVPDDDLRLI